jgi:hypothetical protein
MVSTNDEAHFRVLKSIVLSCVNSLQMLGSLADKQNRYSHVARRISAHSEYLGDLF